MAELTLVPPPGLTKPADPASGQRSSFALFSDSWLELQGYIGSALELPITMGDFQSKYGELESSQLSECIDAMRKVRETSLEFGNPRALRSALIQNPNLLATDTPPNEIYTHTVWMGQRVHQTAINLISGYESVFESLKDLPAKEQVENLKAYLIDKTMGPVSLSKTMSTEVGDLIKKLGKFEQKINEYNEKLQTYTRATSVLMADVNRTIGAEEQRIKDLEKSRDDAYAAWKNFTIAACTSAIGCVLIGAILTPLTGGIGLLAGGLVGLAAGIGLGVKAAENRLAYNQYCSEIASEQEILRKKVRLRSDLGDFNKQIDVIGPAMNDFKNNLQTIEGVWVQMNADMLSINSRLDETNVASIPFLVKAQSKLAIDSWKSIDESAKQFTVKSLVDYTSIPFGTAIPDDISRAA